MKNILTFSKAILAGVLVATTLISCEKKTASVLPDFTGEIKMDRTRIGQGQKLTASYVIPAGGSNIEPGTIYWNCDGNQILAKPTEKNGVSTTNFIADYNVGEHVIEFVRQYLNFDMAASQSKSITGKFTIVECDVLTSFWNDSKALVKATANEKFDENTDGPLTSIVRNPLGVDVERHQYFFSNDKLSEVVVAMLTTYRPGAAVVAVTLGVMNVERDGYTRVSYEYVDMETGVKTAVDVDRLTDRTYTGPISTGVENGKLELSAVLQNAKTKATISYKMASIGAIVYSITYLPK